MHHKHAHTCTHSHIIKNLSLAEHLEGAWITIISLTYVIVVLRDITISLFKIHIPSVLWLFVCLCPTVIKYLTVSMYLPVINAEVAFKYNNTGLKMWTMLLALTLQNRNLFWETVPGLRTLIFKDTLWVARMDHSGSLWL